MKITEAQLKRIIKEEISNFNRRKRSQDRVVKVTPDYLNEIIKEEYYNIKRQKRLNESKRRRRLQNRR